MSNSCCPTSGSRRCHAATPSRCSAGPSPAVSAPPWRTPRRRAPSRFEKPEGGTLPLAAYAGRPILVVNTATACGYAGQFTGLQGLWTRFGDRGLTVIAVPSPDFGNQEPLDGVAIAEAARKNHGVTFPVTAKTHVAGSDRASVLSLGRRREARQHAGLELPQVPGRTATAA